MGQTYLMAQVSKSHAFIGRRGTYDPAIFPNCEKALIQASATARFDGGRGIELLIHVKKTMNPAYDCAIKNLDDR